MTSRGGLNQSLQLCMEFQALVQTGTFVTKPVRVRSGYWPKILIFQLNQEFPDLVYFSRKIGQNSVRILAKNPDFFNKIRSFQVWSIFLEKLVQIRSGYLPEILIFSSKSGVSRFGLFLSRNLSRIFLKFVLSRKSY